jgi:long-chain acyl-CoA synthetase
VRDAPSSIGDPLGDTPCLADLFSRMRERGGREAFWWQGRSVSHHDLEQRISAWERRLGSNGIGPGDPLALLGDYSPESVSLILALLKRGAVAVPFSAAVTSELPELARLAGARSLVRFEADDRHSFEALSQAPLPELVADFRRRRHPGLIVFTSGSTGKPKGILHDCERLLRKFAVPRKPYRTLLFLLMDHFGGFNTLMAALSYGGVLIAPDGRQPEAVARTVERARVELLPVTPTFLNLLLAAGSAAEHDMSSVALISYGTEVMTEATLARITKLFPNARFQQTYGLSELGVLRSKSPDSSSTWVKLGGEGFETRVVDGLLHIRSESAMVGYLNAPNPFDAEGWFNTGDAVEQNGEYLRILGRSSEVINVGGQKVFPAEVETALLAADNVTEATVFAEKHPLMGHVVVARISLSEPEEPLALKARLRKHCLSRLAPFKVPVKFVLTGEGQHNPRFKKARPTDGGTAT